MTITVVHLRGVGSVDLGGKHNSCLRKFGKVELKSSQCYSRQKHQRFVSCRACTYPATSTANIKCHYAKHDTNYNYDYFCSKLPEKY